MKYDLKMINLFGPPSSGKSTTAAGLFYLMKIKGYSVELITEYAKQMVWERQHKAQFENQVSIAAKQHDKQLNLVGHGIEYAITDSPLLLTLLYQPKGYYQSFNNLVFDMNSAYSNYNILLERNFDYSPIGRNHSEEESIEIQSKIKEFLDSNKVPYTIVEANPTSNLKILNLIEKHKWNN